MSIIIYFVIFAISTLTTSLSSAIIITMKTIKIALVSSLLLSVIFTLLVCFVDVRPEGLIGTDIGLAGLNLTISHLLGKNMIFFTIADILGWICIAICVFYGYLGARQLFAKKSLYRVDTPILLLGATYIVTIILYILFDQVFVINYRPIFIGADLESSFPSSHTLLALVVAATSVVTMRYYSRKSSFEKYADKIKIINIVTIVLGALTIVARILSGAHWFTDIIGSIFFAATIVIVYTYLLRLTDHASRRR